MPEARGEQSEDDSAARHREGLSRERERQFGEWIQQAVRYFLLANAGAAVATLSFIGATGGAFPKIALLALLCFIVGVVLAGLVIFDQLRVAYQTFLLSAQKDPLAVEASMRKSRVMRWVEKIGPWRAHILAGAFGSFAVGCVIGMVSLLFWCGSPGAE